MTSINHLDLSQIWGGRFSSVGPAISRVCTLWEVDRFHDGSSRRMFLKAYSPTNWRAAALPPLYDVFAALPATRARSIAMPQRTLEGGWSFETLSQGVPQHLCLIESANGRELTYSAEDFEVYGAGLAALHRLFEDIETPFRSFDPSRLINDTCKALLRAGPTAASIALMIRGVEDELISALSMRKLKWGVCHGDAYTANARIRGDSVVFFDFDDYVVGPLIADVARSAQWLPGVERGQELWESLIGGYRAAGNIPEDDFAGLQDFILLGVFQSLKFLARFAGLSAEIWADQSRRLEGWINFWKSSSLRDGQIIKFIPDL